MDKILLIYNSYPSHSEVVESVIVNHPKIIKQPFRCNRIFLVMNRQKNLHDASFYAYIKKKYKNIVIGKKPKKRCDFFIEITFYPKRWNSIKDKDKTKCFYICHDVCDQFTRITAPNLWYLTPLAKYNVMEATILPFTQQKKKKTKIPIFVIQGRINRKIRTFDSLIKVLKHPFDLKYKIKLLGRGIFPPYLEPYKDKIILKNNLDFIHYHKEFNNCYAILPLLSKERNPGYYTTSITSSINYAKAYKLKCILDADLQKIYKLKNSIVYKTQDDIIDAFGKALKLFYNKK